MKTRFHRILSVVMAFCLLLSAMPLPTMAEETGTVPSNEATNGSYVDGVWTEGGNGSTSYNIDGTDVTLSKTATPVEGMENTFDITLKVQTSTTTTIHTASGAVVLVFDVSGSMNYCAECGNESRHEDDCTLNEPTEGWFGQTQNSRVEASQTRIAAARSAGAAFLKSYAGTDASAIRDLSIVVFATNYSVRMDWANVAGGPGSNSYDAAYNSIMGLSANGGTNLEGGLYTALTQLSDVAGYDATSVVVLTDGVPTYRIGGGNGSDGSSANNSAAANQATAIKNTGAKLYSVCFGVANETTYQGGPTVGNFLRDSVASSGCAYNADNSAELHAAFSAITESITDGLDGLGWTATDPMADMISVVGGTGENFYGADGSYTWKLANAEVTTSGNVTTYTYTYTYRVTLDVQGQNFEEGKFFPTNEATYLNVDGQQYAFPVPGVTGVLPRTDVTVTKQWNDADNQDGMRTESVTVVLKDSKGNTIGQPVVLNAENNWTYTWDGETYNLIAQSKGEYHVYVAEEQNVPEGYVAECTTGENNFALVLVNTHEVEKKDITVTKVWNDKGNQDGIRPASVTVNLLADGEVVATAELNEANGWSYTFAGFDVYKAGTAIVYTVEETNVPEGYTASVDGFTVTNSHETAKTSVDVTKIWNDADNQDGIRPNSVTFALYADGVDTGKTLVVSAPTWTGTFTELEKFSNGKEIVYTVQEPTVPEGYTASAQGLTVTNTHVPAVTTVSGSKTWDDNNNQDGFRPESITINLLANGEVIKTITVTEADGWAWTFENLPKFEAGKQISYSITENAVSEYTTTYNGYNVTNKHTPAELSVTVSKVWNDSNDQDGIRPEDITINLLANGKETGKTLVLNAGNSWTGSFTGLPKYENGVAISYTVAEVSVEGYTTVITGNQDLGYTVTNTHEFETTSVSGTKTWVDNNNQDGVRPESITINLLRNGEVIETVEVTAADNWSWTFENLPKYENGGVLVNYSITEAEVDGYVTEINGFNVTNTHAPEKTSVTVTKSWQDNNDQDGIRPNDIVVILVADGVATDKSMTLSEGNNWTGTFSDLDKFANGEEIVYTVAEVKVEGYDTIISGDQHTGYTITNAHTPAVVAVSGTKTWVDNDDQDGFRPDSITINLLRNGEVIDTVTVTAANGWSWSFTNLPKYENHGTPITYTISENEVDGYTTVIDGYNVTNTHAPEQTSVSVTKSWQDKSNQDGIRPNDITVVLVANGEATEKTLVLSSGNSWTGIFTDLDKYADGEEIIYTVEEITVPGYETVITGDQHDGYTITNSHTPATVSVEGKKTWVDADDQDGARPESITIHLKADGEIIDTITVTAEDNWSWSFQNLPKYKNEGVEIVYSVTEDAVEDYSTEYNGYNVINTHTPAQTSVTVTKAWVDNDDQDGIRPNDIVVVLVANGEETENTLTLNDGNNWTGSFTELDKFANGKVITYTVKEITVEGYHTVITGDQTAGYTVTNSHTPATVEVSGTKTWIDADDQDGFRPETITINLVADGVVIDTVEVSAEDNWSWSFVNLPKYKDHGTLIEYAVTEAAVEDYTTTYDGFNVTNSHTPEQTSVTVTKAWADSNNQDGIRPNDITVVLVANGEATENTLVLSSGNNWTGSFTELDKYADGEEITYTVQELEIDGYLSVVTGNQYDGYTITNSHTPAVVAVEGTKTWVDADDQDGFRPETITINLLADGEIIDTVEVTAEDNWSWSFENLPKYKNEGVEIVYSITENVVDDYSTEYNGYNVTNTHTPEQTSVTVTKAWADNDDQDGIRPTYITVVLVANGEATENTLVLNEGNNWTGSFTELDKYANGEIITYTVQEIAVEGYNTVITGDQNTGYTITNSHTPEVVEVAGAKTWDDNNNQDGFRPESITINLLADGVVIETKTVTEADGWAWSFVNLPKYKDHGTLISYAITEDAVEDYTTVVNGYNVTNTHAPEKTSVSVTKAWVDNDDQDGIRPNDITVVLVANGEATEYSVVLNQGNNWSDTFTDLDKYSEGVEIVYTVEEVEVNGYTSVISGNQLNGYTITNSHTPETMSISGEKTWKDKNNQDGFRPESITINLLANGEIIESIEVTEADGWAWTFENLPVFENHGTVIVYSITENAIDDYSTEYDGFNVINTHTPEQTSVTVSKAWYDNNDQDGIRPDEITVILLANGEETGEKLVLDADCNWTGSFTELDKYADGVEIVYTVSEIEVEGYETVITGDQVTGYTITNAHLPETVEVEGAKTWDDADNQDGARPESITINLLRNGEVIDTVEVTEADGWSWSFVNLPKYENGGVEVVYSITENAVEGYSTTYDGYNVTNSYTPAEISITVSKAWADDNDADGLRPDDITIVLYANGEETGDKLVLDAEGNWTGSFTGLPKFEGGVEIVYTIAEVSVKGYNTVIRGDAAAGFVVTNSRTVIPQTGDERNPIIWVGAMIMSAAVVMYLSLESKKRRNAR